MTRRFRPVDWAALGASVGTSVLFALLVSAPFLIGASYHLWLLAPVVGMAVGVYLYARKDRDGEPGPDAQETRFPR